MIEFRTNTKRLALRFTRAVLIAAFALSAVSMMAESHAGQDLGMQSDDLMLITSSCGHDHSDGSVDRHVNSCCSMPCQWETSSTREIAAPNWFIDAPWLEMIGHLSTMTEIPPKRPPRAAV